MARGKADSTGLCFVCFRKPRKNWSRVPWLVGVALSKAALWETNSVAQVGPKNHSLPIWGHLKVTRKVNRWVCLKIGGAPPKTNSNKTVVSAVGFPQTHPNRASLASKTPRPSIRRPRPASKAFMRNSHRSARWVSAAWAQEAWHSALARTPFRYHGLSSRNRVTWANSSMGGFSFGI